MLLTRKLGEKIFIGDNIVITVVHISHGKVRIGIQAPKEVPIYREELLPLKEDKDNGPSNRPDSGH